MLEATTIHGHSWIGTKKSTQSDKPLIWVQNQNLHSVQVSAHVQYNRPSSFIVLFTDHKVCL